jgi:segregation and condensation protein B
MEHLLELPARVESILFFSGEPVSIGFLAAALKISEDEARRGILLLQEILVQGKRGITLVRRGDEVMLATDPSMSSTIEGLAKDEKVKELGKAGLETLSLILYRGPISKSSVNYIRGVNSDYILRSLLVRGLIEKVEDGAHHGAAYRPTFETLSYLGITKVEDLPEYNEVQKSLEVFNTARTQNEHENSESRSEEA